MKQQHADEIPLVCSECCAPMRTDFQPDGRGHLEQRVRPCSCIRGRITVVRRGAHVSPPPKPKRRQDPVRRRKEREPVLSVYGRPVGNRHVTKRNDDGDLICTIDDCGTVLQRNPKGRQPSFCSHHKLKKNR